MKFGIASAATYQARGGTERGGYHYTVPEDLNAGRLHRKAGDALCRPARKFWWLNPLVTTGVEVGCKECLKIANRLRLKGIGVNQ